MLKAELKVTVHTTEFRIVSFTYMMISLIGAGLTLYADRNINYQFLRAADENFILVGTETQFLLYFLVLSFSILTPLICSVTKAIDDRKNRSILMVQRCGRKKYIKTKTLCILILNFWTVVIPLLINLCICHIFYSQIGYDSAWAEPKYLIGVYSYSATRFADMMRLENPLLYNLLYIVLYGVFAVLLGWFAFGLSMFLKKTIYVTIQISLGVFLIFQGEMTLLNMAGLDRFAIYNYLWPGSDGSTGCLLIVIIMMSVFDLLFIYRGMKRYEIL